MNNILLSPIPLDELASVITLAVMNEFEKQKNSQPPQHDNEYLTRKETSKILGVSLPTLNDYTKRGLIPSYRIGTRVRYKKEQVFASLNERLFTKKLVA